MTYLLDLPAVDRVVMVGVCTSAGNAAYLAAADDRVAALATVAGMLPDPALFETLNGAEGVDSRRRAVREARARWVDTGEQTLRRAYSETDPDAINYNPTPGA